MLRAGAQEARPTAAYDLDLYRDQLRELERDKARGVIGETEAERAKVEISRRILDADRALQAASSTGGGRALPVALALVAVLGGSVLLYGVIGAPGYPDLPLEDRISQIEAARATRPGQAEAEAGAQPFPPAELGAAQMAELEELRSAGDLPAERLLDLARLEAQSRNYVAARMAQEQAIGLLGPRGDATLWVDLARMRILAAGGYVSPEAEEALNRALALEPQQGDARFLLGAMYQRQDRPDLAFAIWRDLWPKARRTRPGCRRSSIRSRRLRSLPGSGST